MERLKNPQCFLRLGGMLVALSLIMALIAQYGFDLWPCDLCIVQRYPAFVAVAIALLAQIIHKPRLWLSAFAVACWATASIAFYHTGVEQGWWQGPTACSGALNMDSTLSITQMKAALYSAPVIRCDKPALEIMGITMASANAIFSALLAGLALFIVFKAKGTSHEPKS